MQTPHNQKALLRRPEVERRTGLARSTIYARMADGTFPQKISLSRRCVAWIEEEVSAWIEARIQERPIKAA